MSDDREWPSDDEFDGTEVFATRLGVSYHGDRECRHITNSSRVYGWDRSAAWCDGMDPCGDCAELPEHERDA